MPYRLYRSVTTVLKRLRGPSHTAVTLEHPGGRFVELIHDLRKQPGPSQNTIKVCLTHDIDSAACNELWTKVVEIEDRAGVRSTWNVLTAGPYDLKKRWLDKLERLGFEIGLHGDTHDMAIGLRPMGKVRDRLRSCLDYIGRPVSGYRAPGLGISEPLLEVLHELGFLYDSSLKFRCFYTTGVPINMPYLYPEIGIWELPLSIQDDGLFRDRRLSHKQALKIIDQIINCIRAQGGLFVLNTHPVNLKDRMVFYLDLLKKLVDDPSVEIVLARDLINELRSRIERKNPKKSAL